MTPPPGASERWQRIKRLLEESEDVPADELSSWLDEACGGDHDLRREVEAYLSHEDELDRFIATSPVTRLREALGVPAESDPEADLGRRIGPYLLRRVLGRGGMGTVYLAERQEGFEQTVALKVVQAGFEGREALRRFHRERQILARLDHPNISRLLDGGTSDDGRPYFVMERVEGLSIERFCDERLLSTRERLRLFLPVCDALQFAHRNLVVHRDLKPGNVLVSGDGTPKLLDFGIAKLLGSDAAPTLAATRVGSQPMTLRYASPEQLRGEPVTTASDLYSLAVLLYQVLTGRLPCGLERCTLPQVMTAVCDVEPLPPSDAVRREEIVGIEDDRKTLGPREVAAVRDGDPATLHRRLRGDVDAIVLKALRKEPGKRYASIEQLAADLRRHLDGLPVLAHRGSLLYRARKFAHRHRWTLAAAASISALVLLFTAALVRQLGRTEVQRDRAEQVSEFLVGLFRAAEPDRSGGEPSVRELVDTGRRRLDSELTDAPEIRAELLATLGQVYQRLGRSGAARESLEAALHALRERHPGDHADVARALNDLAVVAFGRGELATAEDLYRRSIAMRQRLGLDAETLKPLNNLAAVLLVRGELDEAETIYRRSITTRRTELGERHPNVATSLRSLAAVHWLRGDLDEAEPLLREALDIRLEAYGPDTPAVASVRVSLGRLAHTRGNLDAAEALYLEALDVRRRRLGDDHLHTALLQKDLAALLLDRGELATAGVLLGRALEVIGRHPERTWDRAEVESVYGAYLLARGRTAEAEPCLRGALHTLETIRGPEVQPTVQARRRLAALEVSSGPATGGDSRDTGRDPGGSRPRDDG